MTDDILDSYDGNLEAIRVSRLRFNGNVIIGKNDKKGILNNNVIAISLRH